MTREKMIKLNLEYFPMVRILSNRHSVKEALAVQGNYPLIQTDPKWRQVWARNLWPKVSTFLRLLIKRRFITCEKFIKHRFQGPA